MDFNEARKDPGSVKKNVLKILQASEHLKIRKFTMEIVRSLVFGRPG